MLSRLPLIRQITLEAKVDLLHPYDPADENCVPHDSVIL